MHERHVILHSTVRRREKKKSILHLRDGRRSLAQMVMQSQWGTDRGNIITTKIDGVDRGFKSSLDESSDHVIFTSYIDIQACSREGSTLQVHRFDPPTPTPTPPPHTHTWWWWWLVVVVVMVVMMMVVVVVIIIHSFYIALFSALEQTHCAHLACGSE